MIIAGTGHRPTKLGGYGEDILTQLMHLATKWLFAHKNEVHLVISGMALGWDQALALGAIKAGIPFHAYVPFKEQDKMWPQASRTFYQDLLKEAAFIKICCKDGYHPSKMQVRNEMMVDDCDEVLALFDGSKGGTWNCIKYAESQNKVIHNLWSEWKELQ